VVFPTYWYGQIHEATCFAGAIALPPRLLVDVLEATLDAIAKSGFEKILILNAHGGNFGFLDFFNLCQVDKKVDYTLYITDCFDTMTKEEFVDFNAIWETKGGHACEEETSIYMACDKGRVDLSSITHNEPVVALKRTAHLGNVKSGYWWYADYPENVVGVPSLASKEKGQRGLGLFVPALARAIKAVEADTVTPELRQEFYKRVEDLK